MAKQYRLGDLVSFEQGVNSARAKKQYGLVDVIYYDQASFEKDYNHEEGFAEEVAKSSFNDYSLNEDDVIKNVNLGEVIITDNSFNVNVIDKKIKNVSTKITELNHNSMFSGYWIQENKEI